MRYHSGEVFIDIVNGELYQYLDEFPVDENAATVIKFQDEEGNSRYCLEDDFTARTRTARLVWKYGVKEMPELTDDIPKELMRRIINVEMSPNPDYHYILTLEGALQSREADAYGLEEIGKDYV